MEWLRLGACFGKLGGLESSYPSLKTTLDDLIGVLASVGSKVVGLSMFS